jgi:hypothetical protein
MKLFRRGATSHEDKLRQEAGLAETSSVKTDRSFGMAVLSRVNGRGAETGVSSMSAREDAEEDDDPKFEAEVLDRVLEIEAMSIDELLRDSADSIARAELDEDDDEEYYVAHAAAMSTRALVLQLRLHQNK